MNGFLCISVDWEPLAKLFRKSDMPVLSGMFQAFYSSIPCDWIIDLFNNGKSFRCALDRRFSTSEKDSVCMSKLFPTINHSLFQHIGVESSLLGKRQNGKDLSFRN
ncbi:MGAT4A_B [Lepeophtheirus salmonis]|uniref:MGAT4A_B n=1 Tax=Lepeophtheirus salmonis TaxID=72036 RepID=A0A7R8CIV3_LEPSM|nr:MGAT4A_B [Lepeophtheirus salmonis]CAF2832372.1 MGAT4A_B [Lepeophtheirus salmonis]